MNRVLSCRNLQGAVSFRFMSEGIYITRFDAEPEFWQDLNSLTHEDLIAELIQNELDAEATHTRIRFEANRFVCEGNGLAVDADGWIRLSFVSGAGKDAPRKRQRIGVKNHGLKTCFTLGDVIVIQSDLRRSEQTLHRDGEANPPPRPLSASPFQMRRRPRAGAVSRCLTAFGRSYPQLVRDSPFQSPMKASYRRFSEKHVRTSPNAS